MRYLLTSLVLLSSFVLSSALKAQDKSEPEKSASPLVGTWVSKSNPATGFTFVQYRKDGWFVSAHFFSAPYSLTRNSIWAVGHWALADDSLILHRLAGSDGLELVPEKRQLAIRELTQKKMRIANVPLDGQVFDRFEDNPAEIESIFSSAELKRQVYEQQKIILPEDAKKDVESYISIDIKRGKTMQYYLSPGGEFLGSIGIKDDDLIGKWEKSGDFLIVSGVTEKNKVAILMELKKTDGQYKLFNAEANGQSALKRLEITPFQKLTPVKLSADGAQQYMNAEIFKDLYADLNSIAELTGIRKRVTSDEMIEETTTSSKSIFEADAKTGAVKGILKYSEEDGESMSEIDGQYDALLGVSLSKSRSTKYPNNNRLQIGVVSKPEPLMLRWFFTTGSVPKTDEYVIEEVKTPTGRRLKTTVKRNGKFYFEFNGESKRTADFDEAIWEQFNAEIKALIEKAKEESPAEQ